MPVTTPPSALTENQDVSVSAAVSASIDVSTDVATAPKKQGLYDPQFEHDACGVGFVVDMKGRKSHRILQQGIEVLKNLDHRGASGAEGREQWLDFPDWSNESTAPPGDAFGDSSGERTRLACSVRRPRRIAEGSFGSCCSITLCTAALFRKSSQLARRPHTGGQACAPQNFFARVEYPKMTSCAFLLAKQNAGVSRLVNENAKKHSGAIYRSVA